MTYNITPEQGITESRNIQAAMWANRIMTRKINNSQCKQEISSTMSFDDAQDMESRVRRYLSQGLITSEHYAPKIDESLNRIRQLASKPKPEKKYENGSKDGLWSTEIKRK